MNTSDQHTEETLFDQDLLMALLVREELFNEPNNETMAQFAFTSQAEFQLAENKTVLKKLQKDFGRTSFRWWLNIFILAAIAGTTALIISVNTSENTGAATAVSGKQPSPPEMQITLTSADTKPERKAMRDEEIVLPVASDSIAEEDIPEAIEVPAHFTQGLPTRFYIPEPYIEDEADVPGLTAEQIKANNKRKLQMLRSISRKSSFSLVPAGASWRDGKKYEVSSFYMQSSEVSNWQYDVFLNDLIADGKTADYLIAKRVKGNWKTVGIPEFEDTYGYTEGFGKFPVLNIPRAGAELYCTWLSTEMNEAITNKEIKWNEGAKPDFRLPSDLEWLRAARGNDSTLQFPWGATVNALQNARGCYLCNFNYGISKAVLSTEGPEGSKGCISTKPNTRAVITTAGRAIDTLVVAPEYSYNPTEFGHYLLMGNAAEMVWTYEADAPAKKGAPRAMGGSWYTHADNVRIESKEQFVGITEGNVNIGFRVVMIFSAK